MKTLFAQRRQAFQKRLLKYLPYVFNDHFVLVLMVGLGALLYQYREWLTNPPKGSFWLYLIVGFLGVALLLLGQAASYVMRADRQYLLSKEVELAVLVREANSRAFLLWSLVQLLGWCFIYPLLNRLGLPFVAFLILVLVLTGLKYLIFQERLKTVSRPNGLDWSSLIATEEHRQQRILRFFALFTNVKGIRSSIKKRPYLNALLPLVKKEQGRLYHNLFWRAFLRSGDYLGLFCRLTLLAILGLISLPNPYLGAGLAVVFNFLLTFQLLSLANHYDGHALLSITPQATADRRPALLWLIRRLVMGMLVVELPLAKSWLAALLLLSTSLIVLYVYLPQKLKAMIDARG